MASSAPERPCGQSEPQKGACGGLGHSFGHAEGAGEIELVRVPPETGIEGGQEHVVERPRERRPVEDVEGVPRPRREPVDEKHFKGAVVFTAEAQWQRDITELAARTGKRVAYCHKPNPSDGRFQAAVNRLAMHLWDILNG